MTTDRSDGVALLAEALAHEHPTGKFHELVRFFERAFRRGPYELVKPLAEFLAGTEHMNYTLSEVERWLIELRHPATHADRRADFVLESDVRPVVGRMVQAAYDVLLNKKDWRSPSTQRRDLWRLTSGTSSETNEPYITRGEAAQLEFQIFDEVGSYPMDLRAGLGKMPPELWAKWPSDKDASSS